MVDIRWEWDNSIQKFCLIADLATYLVGIAEKDPSDFLVEQGLLVGTTEYLALSEVDRSAVSIEGEVVQLWDSQSPAIAQVGLIEDDTGQTKFTSWTKSEPRIVAEGDRVRLRGVQKNWYQGRCSVSVTYRSRIAFPEREAWWE